MRADQRLGFINKRRRATMVTENKPVIASVAPYPLSATDTLPVLQYFEVSYIARYREKLIRVLLIFGEFQLARNRLLRRAESPSRSRLLDRVLARRSLDH